MNLIGLDIGTTSICGVLYSIDENKAIKTETRENLFIEGEKGEYIQDPDSIYEKVKSILDDLIDFSQEKVLAFSLSSQMHGILYIDDFNKALTPFFTWQNQRGFQRINEESLEEYLSNMLGYKVYTGYGIVTHYSLFKEKLIPKKAKSFCNIGDYVCMKLAGNTSATTDITIANSMGIFDLKNGKKSDSLKKLGEECNKYIPKINMNNNKLGYYKDILIIQPLGDNQASFLGSVKNKNQSLLLNYGTAGQISFFNEKYNNYKGFEIRPLGLNEGYIYAAFSLCGGNSYKILANFFKDIVSLYLNSNDINYMKIMDNMDLNLEVENIKCMPLFLGKRGGKSDKAYFKNIREDNFTPQNIVKSLVQGMVEELYNYYFYLPKKIKENFIYLIGAGNGIRKNKHLIKAVELKYNKTISLLNLSEASCLGAIIHAGKAAGVFSNYEEGSSKIVSYK